MREKLFTETGKVDFDALPEGKRTQVTFTSKVDSENNKFPSGKDEGEGFMTLRENRIHASYSSLLNGHSEGSIETSDVVDDGRKARGEETVTITGPRFRQPTQIFMVTEMELSGPKKGDFTNTGYDQK
jgi:hypothetical protein